MEQLNNIKFNFKNGKNGLCKACYEEIYIPAA